MAEVSRVFNSDCNMIYERMDNGDKQWIEYDTLGRVCTVITVRGYNEHIDYKDDDNTLVCSIRKHVVKNKYDSDSVRAVDEEYESTEWITLNATNKTVLVREVDDYGNAVHTKDVENVTAMEIEKLLKYVDYFRI